MKGKERKEKERKHLLNLGGTLIPADFWYTVLGKHRQNTRHWGHTGTLNKVKMA